MPRIKPLTDADRRNRKLLAELAAQMEFEKKSNEEVAKGIGMPIATFYRRKNDPSTFTLGELRRLKSYFPGMEIAI